jgi:hypothetical protein
VALAEIERFRYGLRYAQRQQLKRGDLMGVARVLRRRAKIALRTLSVLAVAWYIGFLLSLRLATGAPRSESVGILSWALILVMILREQIRVETSMRLVVTLLDEDERDAAEEADADMV